MPANIESESVYQINFANQRLKYAVQYSLVPEVLVFALQSMKADPTITIQQAIEEGCREWDV